MTLVRGALAVPGGDATEFAPDMPSLSIAATDHAETFHDYIEASPDWHVFVERGNRFAARRWNYGGEPRDTIHGYISEFGGAEAFQTDVSSAWIASSGVDIRCSMWRKERSQLSRSWAGAITCTRVGS
jgi:hypothetical protein